MHRRSFLAGLGAVAAAPAIPIFPAPAEGLTVAHLLKAKAALMRNTLRPQWGVGPAHYALGDMIELNKVRYRLLATS